MSNTNKELYEWAWEQVAKGNQIDSLIFDLRRHLKNRELMKNNLDWLAYHNRTNMSIHIGYAPLLIEALENIR